MLDPSTPVFCERYRCTLPAADCATRTVRLTYGRRADVHRFPECARCETGVRRREQLVSIGWGPGDLRNEVRGDHHAQMQARHRHYRERVASDFVPAAFGGVS